MSGNLLFPHVSSKQIMTMLTKGVLHHLCDESDQTLDNLRMHVSVLSKQTELFRVMALGHYGTETDTEPFVPESRRKICSAPLKFSEKTKMITEKIVRIFGEHDKNDGQRS